LIEVFSKQNCGHQEQFLGGLFLYVRVSKNYAFLRILTHPINTRGFLVNTF
jgi:hypothetical protein